MTAPKDPQGSPEEGFLGGWSRRKLAAKKVAEPPAEPDPEPAATPEPDPAPEGVDAAYIEALPPLDSIGAGSDIKPFLARGVPEALKNAAMRRLWSATPGVRDYLDPAVDYAWDWNAPGGVPGGGGVLSPTRVAQMLDNLVGGRRTEPVGEAGAGAPGADVPLEPGAEPGVDASADGTGESAPEDLPQDQPSAPPPSAVRRTDLGTDPDKAAPAPQQPAPQRATAVSQPRRHGGAVPD